MLTRIVYGSLRTGASQPVAISAGNRDSQALGFSRKGRWSAHQTAFVKGSLSHKNPLTFQDLLTLQQVPFTKTHRGRPWRSTWELETCAGRVVRLPAELCARGKTFFMRVTECWSNACESDTSNKCKATESLWYKGVARAGLEPMQLHWAGASGHRRSQGGQRGHPKFLQIVILCFERRFSKQINVIRRKSNILAPQNFWAGYATGSGGSAPWCLGRLFTFARYTLRLRIQYKRHINFIVNRERSRQN